MGLMKDMIHKDFTGFYDELQMPGWHHNHLRGSVPSLGTLRGVSLVRVQCKYQNEYTKLCLQEWLPYSININEWLCCEVTEIDPPTGRRASASFSPQPEA